MKKLTVALFATSLFVVGCVSANPPQPATVSESSRSIHWMLIVWINFCPPELVGKVPSITTGPRTPTLYFVGPYVVDYKSDKEMTTTIAMYSPTESSITTGPGHPPKEYIDAAAKFYESCDPSPTAHLKQRPRSIPEH